jgi:ATP phosphoribosyltransferase regulatory subunit HisZ
MPQRYEYAGSIFYANTRREAANKFAEALDRLVLARDVKALPPIEKEKPAEVTDTRKAPGA